MTKFFKEVIQNPECKIQKIGEWSTKNDGRYKKGNGVKPVVKYLLNKNELENINSSVVYFFVVNNECFYIGQTSMTIKKRMDAYTSTGGMNTENGLYFPSGATKNINSKGKGGPRGEGGKTNIKINYNILSFLKENPNTNIEIYVGNYNESKQIIKGVLPGSEFVLTIPPTMIEKYYTDKFLEIQGRIPNWQGKFDFPPIDYDILNELNKK